MVLSLTSLCWHYPWIQKQVYIRQYLTKLSRASTFNSKCSACCHIKVSAVLSTTEDIDLIVLFQRFQLGERSLSHQMCGPELHRSSLQCLRVKLQTASFSSVICWPNSTTSHCNVMAQCDSCHEPCVSDMTQNPCTKWMRTFLSTWSSLFGEYNNWRLWSVASKLHELKLSLAYKP